ncbi:hypothetical protein [Tolypothrix sp. NIES-4075]|nr:hypothetical protein [Tolypothrix sp. NIES-4075]
MIEVTPAGRLLIRNIAAVFDTYRVRSRNGWVFSSYLSNLFVIFCG